MQDDAFDGALSSLADSGLALLRGALHPALVRELGEAAGTLYERVERAARNAGPAGVERVLPRGCRFLPTASSLTLAALDEESGRDVAGAILRTRLLRSTLVASLDGPFRIDLDQAWLRRQYAPDRAPPLHAPHGWHQDGALGHDFAAGTEDGGLLPLVTCWIPLDACGRDAPGLELVARRLLRLFTPLELTPESVLESREVDLARTSRTPSMEPGDALLFASDVLHRTHATRSMSKDRTSVELRVFPAASKPARLAGDRFSEPFGA